MGVVFVVLGVVFVVFGLDFGLFVLSGLWVWVVGFGCVLFSWFCYLLLVGWVYLLFVFGLGLDWLFWVFLACGFCRLVGRWLFGCGWGCVVIICGWC